MSIYSEIKKYLLFLVGFFCLLLMAHIVLLYIYSDAIKYPLPGGTINVGMIGDKPTLNVLNFDTKIENDPNDTVLRFVYRGLVRYSPTDKKIISDLANCDIDSFPTIKCVLNQNALWNDGTNMTTKDVATTYAFFREHALNEYTKDQLGTIDITSDDASILFKFKTRDVTAVQSLFLPILRSKDLEENWSGDMNEGLSFSGPYIYTEKENQKKTIFLSRNPYYTHTNRPFFFDQVRFGFGNTNSEIYKAVTPDIILSDTASNSGNTQWNKYIRPVFYGAFMNAEKLPASLRKSLFFDILGTIETKDEALMPEENIFLGDIPNAPRTTTENNFFQTVFALGYSFGGTFQAPEEKKEEAPKKALTYITAPGNVTPLFLSSTTIDIRGNAPKGTTKIIINDYTLRNFVAKKGSFIYTAKKEFNNLAFGQNIYRASFYAGTKLLAEESVTIYHNTDATALDKLKQEWEEKNTPAPAAPVVAPTNLDPKKLYNRQGTPLSFHIVLQSDTPYLKRMAEQTAQKLQEFGTEVTIDELPLTEIKSNLTKADFSYDIIFTGMNLGLFYYNVASFLHSGQIKSGYNIIRLKDTTLDSLLSRLTDRFYYNVPDRLRDIQLNIQKILERESVVYTFGSPYEFIGTKSTIRGLKIPEFLAGREMLIDIVSRGYFKEGYKLSSESKTVIGFFEWLKNELLSTT